MTAINVVLFTVPSIAITDKIKPKNKEPVSPIKIFAGFLLNNKNPNNAPTIAKQNTNTGKLFSLYANSANVPVVIIVTLVASPSSPSVKLTAFENPVCQNITNNKYK